MHLPCLPRGIWPRSLGRAIAAVACGVFIPATARADAYDDWVEALYRPFQAEQVALSPDGIHVAYTVHGKEGLGLCVLDITNPWSRVTFNVAADREVAFSKELAPAKLQFLAWVNANRLVFAPTEEQYGAKRITPIFVANADGTDGKEIANASDFAEQIMLPMPASSGGGDDDSDAQPKFKYVMRQIRILGLSGDDRNQLLVEAQGEKYARPAGIAPASAPSEPTPLAPTAAFKIDLTTGKIAEITEEPNEGSYYYDWSGKPRLLSDESPYSDTHTYRYIEPGSSRWRDVKGDWAGLPPAAWTLSPTNYFGEHAYPLQLDYDPSVLYIASNVGRDTFAIEALNLKTLQRTPVAQHPYFDVAPLDPADAAGTLVFDEYKHRLAGARTMGFRPTTVWVDLELAAMQRTLDDKFPARSVEILQWSEDRRRYLLRITGGTEPGRYYVYDRSEGVVTEFLRRAPWLHGAELNEVRPFEFDTPAGVHLTGFLTLPRHPRVNPPPVVVDFPAGFPGHATTEFDRDAQVLAQMGVIVVRVNHRGSSGFGRRHRDAIHAGIDRVPIDDVLATLDWVGARYKFDRRRVATYGEGFGGYLAVRALQLHANVFRCAVAIDAPMDLQSWLRPPPSDDDTVDFKRAVQLAFFKSTGKPLGDLSVLHEPELLTKPVLLIVNSDPDTNSDIVAANDRLRGALKRLGRPAEYYETGEDFQQGLPKARAAAFRKIEEFFNLSLYHYTVNVGETKVVK